MYIFHRMCTSVVFPWKQALYYRPSHYRPSHWVTMCLAPGKQQYNSSSKNNNNNNNNSRDSTKQYIKLDITVAKGFRICDAKKKTFETDIVLSPWQNCKSVNIIHIANELLFSNTLHFNQIKTNLPTQSAPRNPHKMIHRYSLLAIASMKIITSA